LLCSASASWVLSNFVFLHIPLPLTLLAFLSAAPCFWGSLLGNHSWVGGTLTQSCFSLVLACLHDAYFPRCLDLNFLFRTLNFPSLFSSKYSIPGRNQTFVLHHISGNVLFFVQMWILVNFKNHFLLLRHFGRIKVGVDIVLWEFAIINPWIIK